MSERYKKVAFGWKSSKGIGIALVLLLASIVVSMIFVEYMSVRGLEDRIETVQLGPVSLPLRIVFLPSIGVMLLFVFSWAYLVEETAYVRATPGPRQEEALIFIKFVKYAALVIAVFTTTLFVPYLLGSFVFLRFLASVVSLMRFLEPYTGSAISAVSPFSALSGASKYLISLNLAALMVVVVTLLFARRKRKTFRPRRK
jgi:hypothetical protein